MTPDNRRLVAKALEPYGATVTAADEIVSRGGTESGVFVNVRARRLQFRDGETGRCLASGPVEAASIDRFVTRFWYWEKS